MSDFIRENKILAFVVGTFIFLVLTVGLFFLFSQNPEDAKKNPLVADSGPTQVTATGSFASSVGYSTSQNDAGVTTHSYIVKPSEENTFEQQNSTETKKDSGEDLFTFEETPAITVFKEYFGDGVFNPETNEGAVNIAKELVSSGINKVSATDMKTTLETMKQEKTATFTPWTISKKYHELKKEPIYEKREEKTGEVYHVYDLVDKKIEILETPAMQAWNDASEKNVFDPANTPNAFDVAKVMSDQSVSKLTYNEVFELLTTAKEEGENLDLSTLIEQVNEAFADNENLPENMKLALGQLNSLKDNLDNGNVNSSSLSDLFGILEETTKTSNSNVDATTSNLPANPLQNLNTNVSLPDNPLRNQNANENEALPANPWGTANQTNVNGQIANVNQNSYITEAPVAGQVVSSSGGEDSGGGGEQKQDPMQMIQQIMGMIGMLKMLPEALSGLLGPLEQILGGGKQGGDEKTSP